VRGPTLGDGLLYLGAFELTHGESFALDRVLSNIQGAEERQEREQCSAGLNGRMRTPAEHFDVS
jgi:hypothetical protein